MLFVAFLNRYDTETYKNILTHESVYYNDKRRNSILCFMMDCGGFKFFINNEFGYNNFTNEPEIHHSLFIQRHMVCLYFNFLRGFLTSYHTFSTVFNLYFNESLLQHSCAFCPRE